jgi:hypothetical protein
MPTLYVYYKPSAATKYNIRWKRATDVAYPSGQSMQVDRVSGVWNNIAVNIPDTDTDWHYEVIAICGDTKGNPIYGRVSATCKGVTLSAVYSATTVVTKCLPVTLLATYTKGDCIQLSNITTTTAP